MRLVHSWLFFILLGGSSAALAEVQPPTVRYESPVDYPSEALQNGKSGSVLLLLSINKEGMVTDAEIAESTSPEFDEVTASTS